MKTDDVISVREKILRIRNASDQLLSAIDAWMRAVGDEMEQTVEERTGLEALTNAERDVLSALAKFETRAEIANHLNISPKTFDAQRDAIRKKLGIKSAFELKSYAQTLKPKEP